MSHFSFNKFLNGAGVTSGFAGRRLIVPHLTKRVVCDRCYSEHFISVNPFKSHDSFKGSSYYYHHLRFTAGETEAQWSNLPCK